jgi:hypothetical protein
MKEGRKDDRQAGRKGGRKEKGRRERKTKKGRKEGDGTCGKYKMYTRTHVHTYIDT